MTTDHDHDLQEQLDAIAVTRAWYHRTQDADPRGLAALDAAEQYLKSYMSKTNDNDNDTKEPTMKTQVYEEDFINAFLTNPLRSRQFSLDALRHIYQYLISVEEDTGEEITLDVVAVCCDFTEDTIDGAGRAHNVERDCDDDDDAYRKRVVVVLQECAQVVHADVGSNTIVYAGY